MNLIEAKEKNLDVFMFHRDREDLQIAVAMAARINGRETFEFMDNIGETVLRCVACGPRPGAGKIARAMKERKKTVREFIGAE